jgi:probable F420-dependent oxidoreductase
MTRIKVGVQIGQQRCTYDEYAEAVRQAEAMGVDSIWNWDHFFPMYGEGEGNHYEGWTLLSAIATLTEKVEIGTLVTCNSYRNPALLMHMANTVDHISHGRLILGMGAGWFQRDYDEFGYEYGTAGSRLRDLRDSLPIVKERMTKEIPAPVRNTIPIMIGGGGEKVTLKLTAQYADLWNGFGPPEKWVRKSGILDDWCAEVGRDPNEIERTVTINRDKDVPENLDAYVEAGATHFIMGVSVPIEADKIETLVNWCDSVNS